MKFVTLLIGMTPGLIVMSLLTYFDADWPMLIVGSILCGLFGGIATGVLEK